MDDVVETTGFCLWIGAMLVFAVGAIHPWVPYRIINRSTITNLQSQAKESVLFASTESRKLNMSVWQNVELFKLGDAACL